MTEAFPSAFINNQTTLLIWSHGFFTALALRRGRIKKLIDKMLPTTKESE